MTGPRVEAPNLTRVLTGDEWEQAQSLGGRSVATAPFDGLPASRKPKPVTGLPRVLSGDEWEHAQTMSGPALKSMSLPALPPIAPRDVTRTPADPNAKGYTIGEGDPGIHGFLTRQLVAPVLAHPFMAAGAAVAAPAAALISPVAGAAVGATMAGSMVYNIAQYGWQKAAEMSLSPEDRARAEADPDRVSGESAAFQALTLGLAPLIHVAGKTGLSDYRAYRASLPMEVRANISKIGPPETPVYEAGVGQYPPRYRDATTRAADVADMQIPVNTNRFAADLEAGAATTRIPNDAARPAGFQPTAGGARLKSTPRAPEGLIAPESATPGKVKPLATDPASQPLEDAAQLDQSKRDYQAERVAQDQEDVSAARAADAEKIAKADAMRPRRRVANYFETEQGAEVLGTMAGRHGLPNDASPYPPTSPLDALWKEGHAAATESYPEGFSMGGALTDNRIPGADELPAAARGVDGLQQQVPFEAPEGATPESMALARALKPSPFRGHSVDELATAALDAQAEIERAQGRVITSATADHARLADPEATPEHIFYEDRGRHADDTPSETSEKVLVRAKSRMALIERELAMRGFSGERVSELMQSAQEQRLERAGMQSDEALAVHVGAEDPFGETPAPAPGEGRGLAPVEGTGDAATRGLSASVERKALANKLTTTLGDLPEYRAIKMADQATRAGELLATDPELARRVALGEAEAPAGLLPESVFVAVENKAVADGDVATIRDLATGKLTSEATTMGQRIRALGERDAESPVGAIQKVIEVRMRGVKDVPRATEETVAAIRAQLEKSKLTPQAWADFINSLRCS